MKNLSTQMPNGGVFSVKAYGAKGDGSADDSAAVTAAVNAASAYAVANGTGAVVLYPPGKYRQNSTIRVKANITFVCYGAYIYNGGTYIAPASEMFDTASGTAYGGGCDNVIILGGIFDAKGQSCPTSTSSEDQYHKNIITISSCRNWLIQDATFRNVPSWHALDFNSVDGAVVNNCRFEGFVDKTISGSGRSFSESIQFDQGGDGTTPCINMEVVNCYMGPAIDGSGLGAFGKLVGSHTNTAGQVYKNIRIIGNNIKDAINNAIQGYSWSDAVISGNIIDNPFYDGIKMTQTVNNTGTRITVNGNTINSPGSRGIYFDGNANQTFTNCVISNNVIDAAGSTNSAIELDLTHQTVVAGNSIIESGSHGLLVNECQDTTVKNNYIGNTGSTGIQLDTSVRCAVAGNRFQAVNSRGVWIANSSQRNHIWGNYIVGANRGGSANIGAVEFSSTANSDNCVINNVIKKYDDGGNEATAPIRFAGSTSPTGNSIVFNSFDGWSANSTDHASNISGTAPATTSYAMGFVSGVPSTTTSNNTTA